MGRLIWKVMDRVSLAWHSTKITGFCVKIHIFWSQCYRHHGCDPEDLALFLENRKHREMDSPVCKDNCEMLRETPAGRRLCSVWSPS